MPLDHESARRALYLTAVPPGSLTGMERGELRALVRSADPDQRAAIVRALALDDATRNPDSAYARGAARGASYDLRARRVRYE